MPSTHESNPYASPQAEELPAPSNDGLEDKRLIILPPKCDLPPRCLFCNQPASRSQRLRYWWWLYFWGVFGISIKWFACEAHFVQIRQQRRSEQLTTLPFIVFFAAMYTLDYVVPGWVSRFEPYTLLIIAGIFLVNAVLHRVNRNKVWMNLTLPKVIRAEPDAVALKHAGRPFLDSLADGAEGFLVVDKIP